MLIKQEDDSELSCEHETVSSFSKCGDKNDHLTSVRSTTKFRAMMTKPTKFTLSQ